MISNSAELGLLFVTVKTINSSNTFGGRTTRDEYETLTLCGQNAVFLMLKHVISYITSRI